VPKFTHHTINCWAQEKNREYCPRNWKDTHAEDLATIDEAIVEDTMRRTTKQGNWQNDYVEEEGTAG